jgi:hypothetical protein
VVSIIFCFAALFQVIETSFATSDQRMHFWGQRDLLFHDAVYFTLVTVATVGYGDLFPISIPGQGSERRQPI